MALCKKIEEDSASFTDADLLDQMETTGVRSGEICSYEYDGWNSRSISIIELELL